MFNRKPPFIPLHPNESFGEPFSLADSKPRHWSNKQLEKWNAQDFMYYFNYKYEQATGVKYNSNFKLDTAMLSRIRKSLKDNDRLKLLIDTYFGLGYSILGVAHFTKSTRQNELSLFLANGVQPPFTTGRPVSNQETEVISQPVNNRSLEDFFGGK